MSLTIPYDRQLCEFDSSVRELKVRVDDEQLRDAASSDELVAFLEEQFAIHLPRTVVFDVEGRHFLSSGALWVFFRCLQFGARVRLINASPHIKDVIERMKLDPFIEVCT